jgi:hypothetical protein
MNKLAQLLSTVMSVFAALGVHAATANTVQPDRRADENTVRELTDGSNIIAVSESAKRQIGARALEADLRIAQDQFVQIHHKGTTKSSKQQK